MKHHRSRHFLRESSREGGHNHHGSFRDKLDLSWELPQLPRAGVRRAAAFSEAGPKQFRHSRFRGNNRLDAILNQRALMKRGSRGRSVSIVQQALIDLGFPLPRFGVDGDFGSETRGAVVDFQRDIRRLVPGFGVDGIVGHNTMDRLDLAISRLRLRKDVTALTPPERIALINAMNEFERLGIRRQFVMDHGRVSPIAHGNSGFLPWHRRFIMNFESRLRKIDDTVSLPYWNWSKDPGVNSARQPFWNPIMTATFGGNGTGNVVTVDGRPGSRRIGRELLTGPMSHWPFIRADGSRGGNHIARQFRLGNRDLPTELLVERVKLVTPYDVDPFDSASTTLGFRNALERRGHNGIHVWVGGQMSQVPVSPNDPVFFLHHCMVDKIWAEWQADHPSETYLPATRTSGAPGINDSLPVFNLNSATPGFVTPNETLDLSSQSDNLGNTQLRVRYV